MRFLAQAKNGRLSMNNPIVANKFKEFLVKNEGVRFQIEPLTPPSPKMRKFYFGAVLPLWAYLDENDYKSSEVIEQYHEIAKVEFLTNLLYVKGEPRKVGGTTRAKGKLLEITDKTIDFLEESYGIDRDIVLNTKTYKDFIDRIYMEGKYDTFIDYMKDVNILK